MSSDTKRVVDPAVAELAAEIITEAADLMVRRGQTQEGVYEDSQGRVCVLGALSLASAHRSVPAEVAGEVMRAMHRAVRLAGYGATTLSHWNDQTDQDRVVRVMRDAARRLREGDFG